MESNKREKMIEEFYNILNQWMFLREKNVEFRSLLKKIDINNVVVYGMGSMAIHIVNQLKDTEIKVLAIIDTADNYVYDDNIFFSINNVKDEFFDNVDAIIITTSNVDAFVLEKLQRLCRTVFLSEIIFESMF